MARMSEAGSVALVALGRGNPPIEKVKISMLPNTEFLITSI